MPASAMQSGASLSLRLSNGWSGKFWSTEPVYVSFMALPPPSVRTISMKLYPPGCVPDNSTGTLRYRDCLAGLSVLYVEGDYLFEPLTITVGGHACQVRSEGFTYYSFDVPTFQSVEGTFYDVVVSTIAGSMTLAGRIEFNHDPLISSVVPCADVDASAYIPVHCRPTETLMVKVLNVKQTSAPRLWIRNAVYEPMDLIVECPHVQIVDIHTITCVVPDVPLGPEWSIGQAVYIFLEWQDGSKTEELLVYPFWDPFNAPRLTSLSGCYSDSNDPLHLNQCVGQSPSGMILTIHGERFGSSSAWKVTIDRSLDCYRPIVVNNETITCSLPDIISNGRSLNVKYSVVIGAYVSPDNLRSNAGYITFVQEPRSSSSSSTSASTIALATVFSIVGAILLAACLFKLCRSNLHYKRRESSQSSNLGIMQELSSTSNLVELEQV